MRRVVWVTEVNSWFSVAKVVYRATKNFWKCICRQNSWLSSIKKFWLTITNDAVKLNTQMKVPKIVHKLRARWILSSIIAVETWTWKIRKYKEMSYLSDLLIVSSEIGGLLGPALSPSSDLWIWLNSNTFLNPTFKITGDPMWHFPSRGDSINRLNLPHIDSSRSYCKSKVSIHG